MKPSRELIKFRKLIKAQDLIRNVYCDEENKVKRELRDIDKYLSVAINNFATQNLINSISNNF
jgi:hypothetical protein